MSTHGTPSHWDERPKDSMAVSVSPDSSAGGSGVCPSFTLRSGITERYSLSEHLREMAAKMDEASRVNADIVQQYRSKANAAYTERNRLVAALARIFPSSLEHANGGTEVGWTWVVFVDLPTGQATWHIPDDELYLFDGIVRCKGRTWDRHTTEEKYRRVRDLRDVKDLYPRTPAPERKELVKVMGVIMDDGYATQHQTFGQYRSALVKYIGGLLAPEKAENTDV